VERNLTKTLVGRTFGHYSVLRRAATKAKKTYWLCRCTCGNEREVQRGHLSSGAIVSCGCIGKRNQSDALKRGSHRKAGTGSFAAAVRRVMREYKCSAATDGRAFALSEAEFQDLLVRACSYCGRSPSRVVTLRSGARHLVGGIDRIDSARGYSRENVVPCCRSCNLHKHVKKRGEFIAAYPPALEHTLSFWKAYLDSRPLNRVSWTCPPMSVFQVVDADAA
jgi:hypothetical protein